MIVVQNAEHKPTSSTAWYKAKEKNHGCLWAGIVGGAVLLVLIVALSKLFSGSTPINARAFIDEDATSYIHLKIKGLKPWIGCYISKLNQTT